jgi:hypothetical protein
MKPTTERGAPERAAAALLRISPSAGVTPTDAGVILRSDLGTFRIEGADARAFLDRVVPLLDGSRDREAIVQALAGYSRPSVTALLDLLAERGLIEEVPDAATRWSGPARFFRSWSSAPPGAMARLAGARVLVVGLEPWGAAAAIELAAAGVGALHSIDDGAVSPRDVALVRRGGEAVLGSARREALGAILRAEAPWCRAEGSATEALDDVMAAREGWSLLVAAEPEGDPDPLERVARLAHRAGVVSLWSRLGGTTAVLGPAVAPGRTACRICATVDALQPPLAQPSLPAPALQEGVMGQLLGHLVAMEALRVLSAYARSELFGRLLVEDLTTMETSLHTLVRLPRCRVCGEG